MKHAIILFVLVLGSVSVSGKDQVTLTQTLSYLSPPEFVTWTRYFKECFIPKNGNFPDNDYNREGMLAQDLLNLENTALTAFDEAAGVEDSNFFHALRIFYGLDTTVSPYRIKLIFLPDWAKATGTPEVYSFNTSYPLAPATKVYLADNITTPVLYSDVTQYIENYKHAGYLKLKTIGDPGGIRDRNLKFGNDSTFDAEGITFPFQEIRYYFGSTDSIYFYSIAEIDAVHGVMFFKHKIALSDNVVGMSGSAVCANLGALCPPRCSDITVKSIAGVGTVSSNLMTFSASSIAKNDPIFKSWIADNISSEESSMKLPAPGDEEEMLKPPYYLSVLMLLLGLFVGFLGCWVVMRNRK